MESQPPPLTGIRVLDLSRVLAGPYCAMLLSMLGAEVVKVEERSGDESRTWPPHGREIGSPFLGMNLNKQSIVVNLKEPAGCEVVRALAERSDVLVENFKTGTMEKFGLGYEALRELNPRLVYVSISAFGRSGPMANDPGYEALVQAYTGVIDLTGFADGPPARCGVSFLDMSTGISAALAAVSALLRREHSGGGARVDASLLQTALGLMTTQVSNYLQEGVLPTRIGTAHPSVVPYQVFPTADGNIFIAAGNQNLWERLCRALGLEPLLADARFASNALRVKHREALLPLLFEATQRRSTAALLEPLRRAGVACAPVNTLAAMLADGQVQAIGALAELDDPAYGRLRVANLPFFLDGAHGDVRRRAPRLGEHSRAVLAGLGYDEARIAALFEQGAVEGD
jgi:crotonobetainyl-CoA:carnitine CoA-transferase CaiB-like acyl-CoA transferase